MTTVSTKPFPNVRVLTRRAASLQRDGMLKEAAEAFSRIAEDQDAQAPANPAPAVFPGRGQSLDCWVRAALLFEELGNSARAERAWRKADILDGGLRSWRDVGRFNPGLWPLIDGPLDDEVQTLRLIDGAEAEAAPDSWWFASYIQLYRRGWVKAAYQAKSKAVQVVRMAAVGDQAYRAVAYADEGDYSGALDLLHPMPDHSHLGACLARLNGAPEDAASWYRLAHKTSADEAFERLVKGRSIAIVGAAAPNGERGVEIDSFDLVIRTNFRGSDIVAAHAREIGRRTDVAYFNGNFEPDNRIAILRALEEQAPSFLVLRFPDPKALAAYGARAPTRISGIANPFYRMNAYAVPKIVHDLLRFEPGAIKVFNADFFLGAQPHYAGYLDYDINLVQSFRGHDVLRNVRYLRLLWRMGTIEVDGRLERILALSEADLIDRIAERLRAK